MSSVQTPPDPRRWTALAVLSLVQFMLVLDGTVVNVALPPIQADLGFTPAGLAWVINGYALAFGGLLLLGGRLGDLVGRRRLFLVGVALFAVASATAGLAVTPAMLVASRFAQGAASALISPVALSMVTLLFAEGRERTRALAIWGGLAGLGGTFGVVVSGVLSDLADWRWIFLINLPVAVVALVLAPRLLPESRSPGSPRLDWPGAVLVTVGLSVVVYALLEKDATEPWTSPALLGQLASGVVLLAGFVVVQSRVAQPLVPLGFLRSRTRATAYLISVLTAAAFAAMFFSLTLYMQQVLGLSALQTGVAYLPFGFSLMAGIALFSALIPRIGTGVSVAVGLAVAGSGLVLLALIPVDGTYLADVLPGMLLLPLGASASFVGSTVAATAGLDESDAGLGSGVLNAAQQVGGAVGLAVLVSLAVTRTGDVLAAGGDPVGAAVAGFSVTFAAAAVAAFTGAVLALFGLRGAGSTAPAATGGVAA